MQLKKDREYFKKFAEELFTIIRIDHREQRPPKTEVIQALYERAQGRPKSDTESATISPSHAESQKIPNSTKQAESSFPAATSASSLPPTHPHQEAKIPKAPLTPPSSIHDAPTPVAATQEFPSGNVSLSSKDNVGATQESSSGKTSTSSTHNTVAPQVIDLSLEETPTEPAGMKRSSVAGNWDASLRAPSKRPWVLDGERIDKEKAKQKELDEIERIRAKRVKIDHVDTNTPSEGQKKAIKKGQGSAPKKGTAGKVRGERHDDGNSGLRKSAMHESSEQLATEYVAEPKKDEQSDEDALGHESDPEDLAGLAKELEAEWDREALEPEAEAQEPEAEAQEPEAEAQEPEAELSNEPSKCVASDYKSASDSELLTESCPVMSMAEIDSLFDNMDEEMQAIRG